MKENRKILLKGLLATTLIWGGLLLFFVAIGSDFGAERGCRSALIGSGRCRLSMCGFIRGVVPGAQDAPCWLLNAMPFLLIPGFVVWRIIQNEARLLLGERRRAR